MNNRVIHMSRQLPSRFLETAKLQPLELVWISPLISRIQVHSVLLWAMIIFLPSVADAVARNALQWSFLTLLSSLLSCTLGHQ